MTSDHRWSPPPPYGGDAADRGRRSTYGARPAAEDYDQPGQYGSQPGYASQPGYGSQPGYASPPGTAYGAPPGTVYGGRGGTVYGGQSGSGYGGQSDSGYGGQSGPGYGGQSGTVYGAQRGGRRRSASRTAPPSSPVAPLRQYPAGAAESGIGDIAGAGRAIRGHGRLRLLVPPWVVLVMIFGIGIVAYGVTQVAAGSVPEVPLIVSSEPEPSPTPPPLPFRYAEITAAGVNTTGFLSWALMDLRTNEIVGSSNRATTTSAMSMIKAWIAADYLRLLSEQGKQPTSARLRDIEAMITESDNAATERIYQAVGRRDSINRMIEICGLTDSKVPGSGLGWGYTSISAQDAVRLGACIADGSAAGPEWTDKILEFMRQVKGLGDFGPHKVLPGVEVARKNGWDIWHEDRTYRTNCLAIGDSWVLAVLLQYPSSGSDEADLAHNSQVCQAVATQLLNPDYR